MFKIHGRKGFSFPSIFIIYFNIKTQGGKFIPRSSDTSEMPDFAQEGLFSDVSWVIKIMIQLDRKDSGSHFQVP